MGGNGTDNLEGESRDALTSDIDILFAKKQRFSLENFIYRGEGNANVVIALPRERKVVRFRKSSPNEVSADSGRARTAREARFFRDVISRFLGSYVQTPEVLRGTPDDMAKLSEAIHHLRPDHRRDKDILETYATKYPDYAFILPSLDSKSPRGTSTRPTFCVEIKPKQGFRHESDQQFRKCTYCMNQYYKLKTGTIQHRSAYCPLDLFSGKSHRMRKALRGLLESPQNNLKIFKDGTLVFDCNSQPNDAQLVFADWFAIESSCTFERYFDLFCQLVCATLLKSFHQEQRNLESYYFPLDVRDSSDVPARINVDLVAKAKKILYFSGDGCDCNTGQLPPNSVLGRIFRMQQVPYYSTNIVSNIHSKHLAVLTDEIIYAHFGDAHEAVRSISPRRCKQKQFRVANPRDEDSIFAGEKNAGDSFDATKNSISEKTALPDDNGNEKPSNSYDYKEAKIMNHPTRILAPLEVHRNNNMNKQNRDGDEPLGSSLTAYEMRALQNYLLTTTAKDCSILMAFQQLDANMTSSVADDCVVEVNHHYFVVNVGVSDLDPKSIHCIKKHQQRDSNVLSALINVLEEELAAKNQVPLDSAEHYCD